MSDTEDLHNKNLTQLKKIAKDLGIRGYTKYTKDTKRDLAREIEQFKLLPGGGPLKVAGVIPEEIEDEPMDVPLAPPPAPVLLDMPTAFEFLGVEPDVQKAIETDLFGSISDDTEEKFPSAHPQVVATPELSAVIPISQGIVEEPPTEFGTAQPPTEFGTAIQPPTEFGTAQIYPELPSPSKLYPDLEDEFATAQTPPDEPPAEVTQEEYRCLGLVF